MQHERPTGRASVRTISTILIAERGYRSIECRRDTFETFNRELDDEMRLLIWEQEGVGSYFINEHGRQDNNMPIETNLHYDSCAG